MAGAITIKIVAIRVRRIGIITITTGSTIMIARSHAIGTAIITTLFGTTRAGIGARNGSRIFEKELFSRPTCDEEFDLYRVTFIPVLRRHPVDTVTS